MGFVEGCNPQCFDCAQHKSAISLAFARRPHQPIVEFLIKIHMDLARGGGTKFMRPTLYNVSAGLKEKAFLFNCV